MIEDRLILEVRHQDGGEGSQLQGFHCVMFGPSGDFTADDRNRETTMGLISPGQFPNPKTSGGFEFPRDFSDGIAIEDLRDGRYSVYWSAWVPDSSAGLFAYEWVDVARDEFQVLRDGRVV